MDQHKQWGIEKVRDEAIAHKEWEVVALCELAMERSAAQPFEEMEKLGNSPSPAMKKLADSKDAVAALAALEEHVGEVRPYDRQAPEGEEYAAAEEAERARQKAAKSADRSHDRQ